MYWGGESPYTWFLLGLHQKLCDVFILSATVLLGLKSESLASCPYTQVKVVGEAHLHKILPSLKL